MENDDDDLDEARTLLTRNAAKPVYDAEEQRAAARKVIAALHALNGHAGWFFGVGVGVDPLSVYAGPRGGDMICVSYTQDAQGGHWSIASSASLLGVREAHPAKEIPLAYNGATKKFEAHGRAVTALIVEMIIEMICNDTRK